MHNLLHENFLRAVEELKFRFPVARLSEDTGYKSPIISEYLNSKKAVSEKFAKKFCEVYNISFSELSTNKSMFTEPQVPATDEGFQRVTDIPGYLLSSSDIAEFSKLKKQLEGRNIYDVLAQLYQRIEELEKKVYNKQ